jgi:hypothetical protein
VASSVEAVKRRVLEGSGRDGLVLTFARMRYVKQGQISLVQSVLELRTSVTPVWRASCCVLFGSFWRKPAEAHHIARPLDFQN